MTGTALLARFSAPKDPPQAREEKSNEITAIPEPFDRLEPTGALITIDAVGCEKKTAGTIAREDNYLFAALTTSAR